MGLFLSPLQLGDLYQNDPNDLCLEFWSATGDTESRPVSMGYVKMHCTNIHVHVHDNSDTQKEKESEKERQSNTTQHKTWDNFFQRKSCTSGGTRTHASRFLDVMLYQLSYWGSSAGWVRNHLYKSRQSKAKWASQPDKQVNSNLVLRRRPG